MNIRLEQFLAGTAAYDRTIYRGGGRMVKVFDRAKRRRSAARALLMGGLDVRDVIERLSTCHSLVAREKCRIDSDK